MAALLRCVGFSLAVFITILFIVCPSFAERSDGIFQYSQNVAASFLQPVEINRLESDLYENSDIENTIYHVVKREVENSPPIKKATQNEKKTFPKTSFTYTPVPSKKLISEDKSAQNSTVAAESANSTHDATVASAAYNTEIASSSSTSTQTSIPTVSTSTLQPEVMPTRPSNITNTTVDYHVYYNSTLYLEPEKAMSYWVDFEQLPKEKITVHQMLSASYRRAATVLLTFDFPFYGHPLRNITIATGGFLYMGGYMHSWLAATQYVAPLMANFDTSLSNDSTVRYYDNGTAFIIEWNEVTLQDEKQGRNFSFQATLLNNGNIIFVYQTIPVSITQIGDDSHPVKVGLSDAYVIDRVIYFIRRKTIYEYHRVEMKKEEIGNHTAIYFTALTTCLRFTDCKTCMNAAIGLECVWCESAKRCSDGLDRQRQDWLQQRCDVDKNYVNCSATTDSYPVVQPFTEMPPKTYVIHTSGAHDQAPQVLPFHPNYHDDDNEVVSREVKGRGEDISIGGVVGILLILGIVLGVGTWIGYAYRNPHTSSGQLLIRYRPTQWRFRRGEARYTAASVHM